MITDKDVQKLGEVLATKEDIKGLATKGQITGLETHMNELAGDVVRIEGELKKEIGDVKEQIKQIPTRDELPALFEEGRKLIPRRYLFYLFFHFPDFVLEFSLYPDNVPC